MTSRETLADALRLAADGDRDALRRLYAAAAPRLYGLTLRLCGEREVAEEAVQDAFMAVWRRGGSYDPARGDAMAWLAAVARNSALDHMRRRDRAARVAMAEDAALFDSEPDPRSANDQSEALTSLMRCLDRLNAEQRRAVLMAYYEGRTREEIAATLRLPVGTVKTRLRRALRKLRDCMDPQDT